MAQFLRPDSNVTQTSFTNGFAEIDEATASDTDFAFGANNTAAVLEVGLSNPAATPDPAGTSTVRYRIAKTNNGTVNGAGNAVNITPGVYQGSTLIQAGTAQTATGTWTGYTFTFTHGSITDWTDVRLRFTTSASGGSPANRRGGAVSWAEVEAPNAAPQALVLTADPASFSLVGVAALVRKASVIAAAPAAFNAVGVDAGFAKGCNLSADAGVCTFTGNDATLTAAANPNKVLTADVGSLGLTGIDAGLIEAARLTADPGVFILSGIDAGIRATRLLSGGLGSFTFSGIDAGVLEAARLNADTGIFTLSGIDASTSASRNLVAQTGTYIFTGISAALIKTGGGSTDLIADTGSFLITPSGGSGGFSLGSLFSLDQGSFSLVGNTIPLRKTYRLSLETGLLQYGGNESVNRIRRVLQPEQVDKVYAGNFVDIYPFLKVKRSPPRRHPSGRGIAPRF
jgi:hypothetical protein